MKTIRFGIIGCGLMGREFASAAARWCHLADLDARPELVAVCNRSAAPFDWFRLNFPGLRQFTHDYRELLANPLVEAVYVAAPHHLHQEFCCAAISAGKHLMAEKPVGIDLAANDAILECADRHPEVFEILGTRASARFSTRDPQRLEWLDYSGGEQVWGRVQTGHETAFKTITGPIFEFGFPDAVLQMWAAFLYELAAGRPPKRFTGCATLDEAALSHRLFTAALASHQNQSVETVKN